MNKLQQAWDALNPTAKRNTALAAAAGSVLLVVWIFVSAAGGDSPRSGRGKEKTIESVLTDADPRQAGFDAMVTNIRNLERKNSEMERKLKNLQVEAETSEEEKKAFADLRSEIDRLGKEMEVQRAKNERTEAALEKAKSAKPKRENADATDPVKGNGPTGFRPSGAAPAAQQSAAGQYFQQAPVAKLDPSEKKDRDKAKSAVKIRTITQEPDVEITKSDAGDDEIYVPAGSILNGALITGLDAPTGNGARRDPFPVLLRIKREAILPNRFRADVRECFIIASGFGDLSSERAYIRGETISCVREDGGVIESSFDAYASGEDGKAGVRGRLVSKQGQMLARSLMAGFLEGVAAAFTPQQVPSLTIRGSGSSGGSYDPVYEQAVNSESMQGAAFGGAGKALERIADFYLEMAEGMFPVIEVDAGREIDFIMKKGAKLKMKSAKPVS